MVRISANPTALIMLRISSLLEAYSGNVSLLAMP
jgi:hypothetical protein